MDAAAIIQILRDRVPEAMLDAEESIDHPTISVDRDHLVGICTTLHDDPDLDFSFLAEVTAIDWLPKEPRFEVVYHMACLGQHGPHQDRTGEPTRLRVKVRLAGDDARVPTVSAIWPSAGWPEREVWDLFGIVFDGHPDLRRILMPDDWEGHPLRKDHPVQVNKRTRSSQPLQVTQEEFLANMEGARAASGARPPAAAAPAAGRQPDPVPDSDDPNPNNAQGRPGG